MEKLKSNLCKMSLSFEAYEELLALIGVKTAEQFETLTDEEIQKRLHTIRLAINNHADLIEQNRSLQTTILKIKKGEYDG